MQRIVIRRKNKITTIVLVEKHKTQKIIGFIDKNNKLILDFNLFVKKLHNGCNVSKTALDLIYKGLSNYIEYNY